MVRAVSHSVPRVVCYSGVPVASPQISPTRLSRSLAGFSKPFCYLWSSLVPGPSTPQEYLRFGLYRFRSPLLTVSISLSFPPLTEMFHFSGSRDHNPMYSGYVNSPFRLLGYPIRTSPDLSSLAAPRGFSQLAASFFAYRLQGILHKPFLCLHALSSVLASLPPVSCFLKKTFVFLCSPLSFSLKLFFFPLAEHPCSAPFLAYVNLLLRLLPRALFSGEFIYQLLLVFSTAGRT